MKTTPKSSSAKVLKVSAGGSSAQIAPPQPLQSLAPGETPIPSSALVPLAAPPTSTPSGGPLSNGGSKSALTGKSELDTKAIVATLNWALHFLTHNDLVEVGMVSTEDDPPKPLCYRVEFSVERWVLTPANTFALKESKE